MGFLSLLPQETLGNQVKAFHEGLARQGFAPGSTVAIEYRWADNDAARLPALAVELVRVQPAVIVAAGGNISAAAAAWRRNTRLPGVYQWRQFVEVGGLASYGPSFDDAYCEAGVLTGRVLRGERPANLPVLQPTKFELVINQREARGLGLVIPSILLTRADEIVD